MSEFEKDITSGKEMSPARAYSGKKSTTKSQHSYVTLTANKKKKKPEMSLLGNRN